MATTNVNGDDWNGEKCDGREGNVGGDDMLTMMIMAIMKLMVVVMIC
jgi:hypothetical protein